MTTLQAKSAGVGNWGDIGGDYCPPFSEYCDVRVMAASTAKTFTVPAGMTRMFFQISQVNCTMDNRLLTRKKMVIF